MKKVYQVIARGTHGFLMLEVLISISIFAVSSLLVANFYTQILHEDQKIFESIDGILELTTVMNRIKAMRSLAGTYRTKRAVYEWSARPLTGVAQAQYITLKMRSANTCRTIIFGVR